jgi:hypothetical protein
MLHLIPEMHHFTFLKFKLTSFEAKIASFPFLKINMYQLKPENASFHVFEIRNCFIFMFEARNRNPNEISIKNTSFHFLKQ